MYKIIRRNINELEMFEEDVSFWLRNGYKLAGGLIYTHDRNVMQAIYKEG